jgi:hypothetical protein
MHSRRGLLYGETLSRNTSAIQWQPQISPPYMSAGTIFICSALDSAMGKLPRPAAVNLPLMPYKPFVKSSLQAESVPLFETRSPKNFSSDTGLYSTSPSLIHSCLQPIVNTLHLSVICKPNRCR